MKKLTTLLFAATLLSGCMSMPKYTERAYATSYSEYKGFFLSEANSVSFDYDPIGSVEAVVSSGYRGRELIIATAEDALYVLTEAARKDGANGVINLKITYVTGVDKFGTKVLHGVTATGMAIRY